MRLRQWLLHGVENILVAGLVVMWIMVFGNVVLRYAFNSGIIISEEVSRIIFVWLTLGGAFLVARENGHLGMHSLVNKLSPNGKFLCQLAVQFATLFCMSLLVIGCWKQMTINMSNYAPASGIPTGVTYMAGVVSGIGIGALNLQNIFLLIAGKAIDPTDSSENPQALLQTELHKSQEGPSK